MSGSKMINERQVTGERGRGQEGKRRHRKAEERHDINFMQFSGTLAWLCIRFYMYCWLSITKHIIPLTFVELLGLPTCQMVFQYRHRQHTHARTYTHTHTHTYMHTREKMHFFLLCISSVQKILSYQLHQFSQLQKINHVLTRSLYHLSAMGNL